jgi:hypothetical protein
VAEAYRSLNPPEGRAGHLVRKGAKSGPENRPVFGPSTNYAFSFYTPDFSFAERDKWTIEENDVKVMAVFEDPLIVPRIDDSFVVDGKSYSLVSFEALAPGGIVIRWALHGR